MAGSGEFKGILVPVCGHLLHGGLLQIRRNLLPVRRNLLLHYASPID
jgi:hypothetical protein